MLDFRRKNAPAGVATITLGQHPDRDYGFLGVSVMDAPWAPFAVDFNLANVGGPSAGLMFSLAVIDKLTTGDLVGVEVRRRYRHDQADGKVGPIGGITHKMLAAHEAGATVFLVPAENCYEAISGQCGRSATGEGRHPRRGGGRAARGHRRWGSAELLTTGDGRAANACVQLVTTSTVDV